MDSKIPLENATPETLAREIAKILFASKALDVRLYNVTGKTSVTDFYVNCTGRSGTQVVALADEVSDRVKERGQEPDRVEGRRGNSWLLVDYGNVIVNVFDRESRDFYHVDKNMPEGSEVDLTAEIEEVDRAFQINKTED